jgi:predicted TIM-barrel fold metal-dependent hydrolase
MATPDPDTFSTEISDADQHYYESVDAFTRHLDPAYRRTIRWADVDGRKKLLIGDRLFKMIPNPTFDPIARPGTLAEYFQGKNHAGADAATLIGELEPIRPEYQNRDRRVATLDEQGISTVLLLPTLALGVEELLHDDPPALHAAFRAFNSWVDEDWGFNRDGRIVAPAVMTLVDPVEAEKDLAWVIEHGARAIAFRPAPVVGPSGSRSPADAAHDRFWAMAAEAGLLVAYHAADSGYAYQAANWGERTHFTGYKESPFTEILSLNIERPVFDTMAALVAHGLFDRHPTLRVATVELGSGWVRELLRRMAISYGKSPQAFQRDPVEAFREHVWVAPFQEDHLDELVGLIGADHVLFGSDWPHPEGVAEPRSFLSLLDGMAPDTVRRIMSDNLKGLLSVA